MRNLKGWTILVMGASDGVGYEAAKAFAEHGAHVIVHGRDEEKTSKAAEEIRQSASEGAKVDYLLGDLASFKSMRAFAEEYKKRGWPLNVLLNNAAIQSPKGKRGAKTEDGFEITLQVNHFGLVYVTLLLLDLLKAAAKSGPAARIVWVTSLGSQLVNPPVIGKGGILGGDKGVDEINWNDLKGEHMDESDWWRYSQTKIFNIMTSRELADRLEGTGVQSFVAHPGLAVTDHFGKSDSEHKLSSKIVETYANSPIGQSAENGAIPLEYASVSADLEGKQWTYIGSPETGMINCFQAREQIPNAPLASDKQACSRLWTETVTILDDTTGENLGKKTGLA